MESILKSALRLAKYGISVIPLHGPNAKVRNPGKQPVGKDWQSRRNYTPEEMRKEFRESNNIGVRLGRPSVVGGSYLHVIDVDVKHDGSRDEALAVLGELFPQWETYPRVHSGSGGSSMHIYLFSDKPLPAKKLRKSEETFVWEFDGKRHNKWEIDLKGTGTQAVLPPSIHPDTGYRYTWGIEIDLDLMEMLGRPEPLIPSSDILALLPAETNPHAHPDEGGGSYDKKPIGLTLKQIEKRISRLEVKKWFDPRDKWLVVGMAIHHETSGSNEGLDIWDKYSQKSDKWESGGCEKEWKTFKTSKGHANSVTMRTILQETSNTNRDFATLWKSIENSKDIEAILDESSEYRLTEYQEKLVIERLREIAKREYGKTPSAANFKSELRDRRAKNDADISRVYPLERRLAEYVLEKHYSGGTRLLLANKNYWLYSNGVWKSAPDITEIDVKRCVQEGIEELLRLQEKGTWFGAVANDLRESDRTEHERALVEAVTGVLSNSIAAGEGDPMRLSERRVEPILNCQNCEVHFLNDGGIEVKPHNPDNRFTRQVRSIYDPGAECPLWDKAILEILGDPEIVRHFEEQFGYIAQNSRTERMFMLLHGGGSNGKSLLIRTLAHLMGDKSVIMKSIAEFSGNTNNHVWAGLVGKLMLIDDDYKKDAYLPDGPLKILSEGSVVTANPKNQSEFNYWHSATPVILTNHWPKTKDNSFGLVDRAYVYEFTRTFRKEDGNKDTHLLDKLIENELPGILNRLIQGYRRFRKRGGFDVPVGCEGAKNLWLANRNTVSAFVESVLIRNCGHDAFTSKGEMWEWYKKWCASEGHTYTHGRMSLVKELSTFIGEPGAILDGYYGWRGVRVNKRSEFFKEYLAGTDNFDTTVEEDVGDLL